MKIVLFRLQYTFAMRKKYYLGIDWGGTYIKAGIVNGSGQILAKETFVSETLRDKPVFIEKICSFAADFKKFHIEGIGIGAPGIVDVQKGFIYYLPNVPGWEKYPLAGTLEKKLGISVTVDNDANVFALAETRLGSARGAERVIFLTLGTGVGGAVIFGGKLLEGKISALELGHVPLSLKGKPCGCGGSGCVETFLGNKYLIASYRSLKKDNEKKLEVKDIYKKALGGEKEALFVWREFSTALGKFLAGMVNVFSPEVIVLGGGVSGAFKIFKPWVFAEIKRQAMWPQVTNLKLVRAKLKDAGIVGAALLAKEKINLSKIRR